MSTSSDFHQQLPESRPALSKLAYVEEYSHRTNARDGYPSTDSTPSQISEKAERRYLWVNKDSKSAIFSRSEGEEASSILRFVQQGRKPSRKRRFDLVRSSQHDFVAFRHDTIPEYSERHPTNTPATLEALQTRWRFDIPRNNFIPASGIDPFKSSVVPIDGNVHYLLQYTKFSLGCGAGGYKLEVCPDTLKPMNDMYTAATNYLFQNMMHLKFIIYPVLGSFSRRLERLTSSDAADPRRSEHYMHLATTSVRESLSERSRQLDLVATGVHFLVCSAGLAGRYEESDTHMRAFLRFLPYIDTNDLVGYWELDAVGSWDVLNAAATGRVPYMRSSIGDPGPMPATRFAQFMDHLTVLQRDQTPAGVKPDTMGSLSFDLMSNPSQDLAFEMGSALEMACDTRRLHHALLPVTLNLLGCLAIAKVIWKAPGFANTSDTKWLCKRVRAVLHSLLNLKDSESLDKSTQTGMLAECVRLTLIIVLMSAQSRLLHQSRHLQAARLRFALQPLLELRRTEACIAMQDEEEMLFWILVTGCWAAQDLPDESWFASKAMDIFDSLHDDGSFNDMKGIMGRYLYAESVQKGVLTRLLKLREKE